MPESFGARLRQQREKSGIALAALAKQTRIKESLLEALERDDLSQWPTGFYRRAFFRAYASAVGLDADAASREFLALHPEPPACDVVAAMAATLGVDGARGRLGIRSKFESAISSLARLRGSTAQDVGSRQADIALPRADGVPPRTDPAPPVVESSPPPEGTVVGPDNGGTRHELPAAQLAGSVQADTCDSAESGDASALGAVPGADVADVEPPIDLAALARVCVEFGCVRSEEEMQVLLQEAARLIGASGLIVWALHPLYSQLHATLVHGYSPRIVAQLPAVRRSDNNATAEAYRTVQTRVFKDSATGKCAVAIPLRTAAGCVGVFAVELERGRESTTSRVAAATVLSAQLAPIADALSQYEPAGLPRAVNGDVQTV